ncbi:MAG: VWA domain-containing protein [Acidobacteriota bacterium]
MRLLALFLTIILMLTIIPQSEAQLLSPSQQDRSEAQSDSEEDKTIKVETTVVTVPIIASTSNGTYVTDLKKEEFTINEDGNNQEIVFFATVTEPFQVVLLLDTSGSTEEKLAQIQSAAKTFVDQLQQGDRIKVISFDDEIYQLSDFTNDRATLKKAIDTARAGQGTKLYDAVQLALRALGKVQGRKAIVLFTDGVDFRSDSARQDDNLRAVEESGVVVYPIRFDTRVETERIARQQQRTGQPIDPSVILGGGGQPNGTTPPTVGGGSPVPRGGQNDPFKLPIPLPTNPPVIGAPDQGRDTNGRFPDNRFPDQDFPDRREDSLSVYLNTLYKQADLYLNSLATQSGGKIYRADTLSLLPGAFSQIAAELRTQYSLGYYPSNPVRDGKFRKIKVRTSRKNVSLRTRPGYRVPRNNRPDN